MRNVLVTWVMLLIAMGCARADAQAPAASNAVPLSPSSDIDQILDALDARGKNLNDFTAKVSKTDTDSNTGDELKLSGTIRMQRLPGDDARLRVLFDRKQRNDKAPTADKQEYLLAKGMLIDRDYGQKIEIARQVLKPGQKMNLLKLGEGPFPLPLGQDKADVHKMFDVKKIDPGKDDPPGMIHAQLKPKPDTQFAPKFATIDFWVDPATQMPVKIVTEDPNGTTTITTELKEIAVNTGLKDDDFKLERIDPNNWSIRQQAYEE